jgi:hypothetical protein
MIKNKLFIKENVDLKILKNKYRFFYHSPSNSYWYVLNKETRMENNVEVSIVINVLTREIRLYATNDHKKLPSIFSKKYNRDNYLMFEEALDQYSFADYIPLNKVFKLIQDGIVEIV